MSMERAKTFETSSIPYVQINVFNCICFFSDDLYEHLINKHRELITNYKPIEEESLQV